MIQPFDKGRFDKRYAQVYVPAIKAADLEPYRVDKDFQSDVPIDSIEEGIRAAAVCLADITTDNPNVWYELGFAYACGTPVVIVCAAEREGKKYPFDIQHRTVTSYTSDAPEDFQQLQNNITLRLNALVEKGATMRQLAASGQIVAPVDGLGQGEMTVLAILAGSVISPEGCYGLWGLQQDTENAGLTKLGCTLGIRKLSSKKLIRMTKDTDS
ncbi:MAG TPA: hypothetical protein VFE22_14345, partial [Edaphobacter sp.]|nr:hypothetical protein [Edaphobacter sp.]